ncbi:cullin-3 [Rhipicephalus sanguineus]|nr:cullin-3 [Rhipicephalus sanguineus]
MLLVLGLNSRSVYEEDFEKPFLAESAQFYALRRQDYIKSKKVFEYVAQVEQHIYEESERAKHCLDESTVVPIVQVVKKELVGKYMKAIVDIEDSGVRHMLKNQMTEDLARLFQRLKYIEGGVEALLDCVSKHMRSLGRFVVIKHEDSVSLIPKVMDLRDRFDDFLQRSFNNEQLVRQRMATDFEFILNFPSFTRKLPMHLSVFVDDMMRQGVRKMTRQEFDDLLDKIIEIFRFMQEKELFKCCYKQHLANRLLFHKSGSHAAERTMVAKLRSESCVHLQDGSHVKGHAYL